jgi:NAD(P)H-dependent FMN reductase
VAVTSRSYLFLLASGRPDGNSELLARHAAASLPEAVARWIRLADLPLPQFEDLRHGAAEGYGPPQANAQALLDATLAATDIVFVAPVYWYSLPGTAKLYLDHWSHWMRLPAVAFGARMKGKTLWAISANAGEPGDGGERPLVETLQLTAGYMEMAWGGALIGHGNRPGDVLADPAAMARAAALFRPAAG